MIRVVLDTNTLVSAAITKGGASAQALDLVLSDERFRLVLSDFILEETRRVLLSSRLARYFAVSPSREAFVDEYLGRLAMLRVPVDVLSTVDAVPEDPPDNQVLACALDGAARYLVTGNERHLGKLGTWQGITILNAGAFLAAVKSSTP